MGTARVALLRGINLANKNRLPMKDLEAMFVDAGCAGVRSYIQSGNIVFTAPAKVCSNLAGEIAKAIAAGFGYRVPVVLRSREELDETVANNPFLKRGANEKQLGVAFLADAPDAAAIARLDPDRSPPDEFYVRGRDVYLNLANGFAKTKLSNAWLDSKLSTVSTVRNWRTVLTLAEMMQDL